MSGFIRRIELWLLFGLTTIFYLTINGSDTGHLAGQLSIIGLLVLLCVPKSRQHNFQQLFIVAGAVLRIALYTQMQQLGWQEHDVAQGGLILGIALCSIFDGVDRVVAPANIRQMVVFAIILLTLLVGSQICNGFNYALGALLCLLSLLLDNNKVINDKRVQGSLLTVLVGAAIGWYVNSQSLDGVVNLKAMSLSLSLALVLLHKSTKVAGPWLLFGSLLGYGYAQLEQLAALIAVLVIFQLVTYIKPRLFGRQ